MLLAAAHEGDANAQHLVGRMHRKGHGVLQDDSNAVEWFKKSAEQGHAKAQAWLSFMYLNGHGVPQDYCNAREWCKKAVDQGDASAQCLMGFMYEAGDGVPQDASKAVEWCQKAADQGDRLAQCFLGYAYENGYGVPQDYCRAVEWCRKAADQGHAKAQYYLGIMYSKGRGVKKNKHNALEWFQKAAEQSCPFPAPPIPGNVYIESITNEITLFEEGLVMHHCVGNYAEDVRRGECYFYRVLKPTRATLELIADGKGWTVGQIKGYCNAKPSSEVVKAVRDWMYANGRYVAVEDLAYAIADTDEEHLSLALDLGGYEVLRYMDEFATLELCFDAVKKNGMALQYVPDEFITLELCFAAVQEDARALQYVPNAFRTPELLLAAT